MFFAFVVRCKLPDGSEKDFAHMVCADTKSEAEKKVRLGFERDNIYGGGATGPLATLGEVACVGELDEDKSKRKTRWDLYEQALAKVSSKAVQTDEEKTAQGSS